MEVSFSKYADYPKFLLKHEVLVGKCVVNTLYMPIINNVTYNILGGRQAL